MIFLQVETKSEREARGQPVGKDVPYAAMGGLTGFSSLLDGYLSLEACGSGTGYVLTYSIDLYLTVYVCNEKLQQ